MALIEASIEKESKDRYLSYAMSVVSGRALPDVRDGLKPVQRRILYAMLHNLNLRPSNSYKKSAAIVGEVLARFHPHGDTACYDAMVRMAQDFSLRYPLVDGQGNFGSLDGDSPAAYRYTEVRLRELAIDVVGEINEETVDFRDNFDSSTVEPIVLPSKVPNLLINGASGIAVGMATNIPPHNLKEVVKAMLGLLENPEITISKLLSSIKGPDFPTGGIIISSKKELEDIYRTGRGSIKIRGEWETEELPRGKQAIIITSIPYGVNKAQLVEKIGDLIINRKVPQLIDVRDESTEDVRIVAELASGADPDVAVAFLLKHTTLENNFSINFTALTPTGQDRSLRPETISLKDCLQHFLDFRIEVVEKRLIFEKKKLLERLHILEGLILIFDGLDKAIAIVRKSDGRSDAAEKLRAAFKLTEIQSFAIVDMRIYQLSKTNILEIREEHKEKTARVKEIDKILKNKELVKGIVKEELEQISDKYGDKRKSTLLSDGTEIQFNAEDYVVQEDVFAIVTSDGWIKRIRQTNDVEGTRVREGDTITRAHALSTLDSVAFFTNLGFLYTLKTLDFPASSGFGDPLQKILKFKDDERVIASFGMKTQNSTDKISSIQDQLTDGATAVLITKTGIGFILSLDTVQGIKRSGRKVMKVREDEAMAAVGLGKGDVIIFTKKGYGLLVPRSDLPVRDTPAVGVNLINVGKDDEVVKVIALPEVVPKSTSITVSLGNKKHIDVAVSSITKGHRGLKGSKIINSGEIIEVSLSETLN